VEQRAQKHINTKHKAHARNAQLTYYSIIKNLLKSTLFRDERKQWRERKSSLSSGRLFPLAETWTEVWGGRSRRVSAENFFCRPPPQKKCDIWGGTAGDSLCSWISIF